MDVPPARRRRRRPRLDLTTPTLLGLPLGWLAVFFVVPIAIVGAYSVDALSLDPGPHAVTLDAWHAFLQSSIYLSLFWKSVKMSLLVSTVVVLLAYPLAYYLALSGTKRKYVLLLLLIAPFLTSYLLRVLAWKVILGNQGVINSFLVWTGLRDPDHPISQLLYSRFAVMLVLGYIWLPFVALPIFVTLESLDRRLFEAATDLGASRLQTFLHVILPLTFPGIVVGAFLTFVLAIGDYITPQILGGNNELLMPQLIMMQIGRRGDFPLASALSLLLMAVVTVAYLSSARWLKIERS